MACMQDGVRPAGTSAALPAYPAGSSSLVLLLALAAATALRLADKLHY